MSSIIPYQYRYVDPYAPLFTSNVLNDQITTVTTPQNSIINGLQVSIVNATTLQVTAGVVAINGIVAEIGATTINIVDTDYLAGSVNYLYLRYNYQLLDPPPVITMDIAPSGVTNLDVIIAFISITNLDQLAQVLTVYNNQTINQYNGSDMFSFLTENTAPISYQSNLNMQNYNITNLPEPVNPTDIATKEYVDTNNIDQVKISANDTEAFLEYKITAGQDLTFQINQSNIEIYKTMQQNQLVMVTSADSSKNWLEQNKELQ
jgi:hypothetical protein